MSTCGEHGGDASVGFAPLEPTVQAEPAARISAMGGNARLAQLALKWLCMSISSLSQTCLGTHPRPLADARRLVAVATTAGPLTTASSNRRRGMSIGLFVHSRRMPWRRRDGLAHL
jgi:hypothetical protein